VLQQLPSRIPAIALSGVVDYAMICQFFGSSSNSASSENLVVIELSTLGGDPGGRADDGRGRTVCQPRPSRSAVRVSRQGSDLFRRHTFMKLFVRENRYLSRGTRLMIHERKLFRNNLSSMAPHHLPCNVQATLTEIECSIAIQNEGFQNLVLGSSVSLDEVLNAPVRTGTWEAQEARNWG